MNYGILLENGPKEIPFSLLTEQKLHTTDEEIQEGLAGKSFDMYLIR